MYLRLALVFVWDRAPRGVGFVGGTGHWAIILCGLKTFLMFPSFLGF